MSAASGQRQQSDGRSQTPPTGLRRSRRISCQGVVDDNTIVSTPIHQPTVGSPTYTNNTENDLIQSPTIDESELIRRGIHPITKLMVLTCSCPNPKECRAIMWRHAKIGNSEMFYASIPGETKVKEGKELSKTAKHVTSYRKRIFHHLYGYGNRDVECTKRNMYVAFHHYPNYPKEYRQTLRDASKISRKMFKWRVPIEIGRQCNPPLTDADLCDVPNLEGECGTSFFAVPILSNLGSAYAEIAEKEREYNERLRALHPRLDKEPVAIPGRKSPKERQIDIKENDAKANPRAVALRLQDCEDEIDALRAEIKKLELAAKDNEQRHAADLEEQNEIFTTQLMSSGLTRLSMLSNNYHNDKPWLSKYLFGRPWKQHVDLAKALFDVEPTTVTLDGTITEFEKYCICSMITRRVYTQHTAAAIYNVDRSTISRYMKKWMPKLGEAGGWCSELDLVMNHNLFSIDYCKENNLPYIDEDGVAQNLST